MDNLIKSQLDNSVLTIELNRPDKKNALTSAMYNTLCDLFNQASNDDCIRVVVIRGKEHCFTAGNDLHDFLNAQTDEELAAVKFVNTLLNFNKPLLAAVAGVAVGIGTTMLLHCDYVVAAPNTLFKMPFTQLGLCPEAASSLLFPLLTGHVKAFEYLVMGESFNEEQALTFGLINHCINTDNLFAHINEKATQIASLPVNSVYASKRLMKAAFQAKIGQISDAELATFQHLLVGDECKGIISKLVTK